MALPGKDNPFANGLTERPPMPRTKDKKVFVKIPLSANGPVASNETPEATPALSAGDAERAGALNPTNSIPAEKSPPAETAGVKKEVIQQVKLTPKKTPVEKSFLSKPDSIDHNSSLSALGWKLQESANRYTRVPHSFTNCLEKEDFSHREYRLLLLLLRETIGWGRACFTMRTRDVLERTKIPDRHLRDTIKALQTRGIIFVEERKSESGQCLPSTFALNPKYFEKYETPAERAGDADSARDAQTAGSPLAERAGGTPCRNSGGRRIVITNNFNQLTEESDVLKKVLNKDLKKSLSQTPSNLPEHWIQFTSQLTEKARERANRVFENLKIQFPDDPVHEIAKGPKNLEQFGAPDGTPWERISSPIGLMESSWPQLRDFFRKRHTEKERTNQIRAQNAVEHAKIEQDELQQEKEHEIKRQAFFTTFPDETGRQAAIQKYLNGLPFKPDGQVGQNLAMNRWWDEKQGETRE